MEEKDCAFTAYSNPEGKLLHLSLETDYEIDNIRLQSFASVYTEYYEQEITTGCRTTEPIQFTESFETNEQAEELLRQWANLF